MLQLLRMLSLEAIADPTRRRIVEMLAERDRPVGEIVEAFRMSAPAISQHLKVLREAGLVISRTEGQSRIQSLNPAGLQEVSAWLARTMGFWSRRLDALEAALRDEEIPAAAGPAAGKKALREPVPPVTRSPRKRPARKTVRKRR